MKLWVFYNDYGYEGYSEPYGVYSSKEKAFAAAVKRYNGEEQYARECEFLELELDAEAKD